MFCRVALLTTGCLLLGTALLLAILCISGVLPASARAPRGTDTARARRGTDVESVTKSALCAASSYVPYVGAVMCAAAEIYWPEASESDLWSQVEHRMERFTKKSVLQLESGIISSEMDTIRLVYQSYLQAGHVERGTKLTAMLYASVEVYHRILRSSNIHCFVLQTIAMGSLHLSLLRERLVAGAAIFPGQNHTNVFWAREIVEWEGKYEKLHRKSFASWHTVRLDVSVTEYSTGSSNFFSLGFWKPENGYRVKDEFLDEVLSSENIFRKPGTRPVRRRQANSLADRERRLSEAYARASIKRRDYISDLREKMFDAIDHVANSTVYPVWQDYGYYRTCTVQAPWFIREGRLFKVTLIDRQESIVVGPHNRTLTFFDEPPAQSDNSEFDRSMSAGPVLAKVPDGQAVPA